MGDVWFALDHEHAPVSVCNFLRYVREGHYDGTVIHRVVPGFVIQAGSYDSPTNARPVHDPIALEANNGLGNVRGTVAMGARGRAEHDHSVFFVNLADNSRLDHYLDGNGNTTGCGVFGHVVSGMDVVDKIASVSLDDNGPMAGAAPDTPIRISSERVALTVIGVIKNQMKSIYCYSVLLLLQLRTKSVHCSPREPLSDGGTL